MGDRRVVLAPNQWYRSRLTLNYRSMRYIRLTAWDATGDRILNVNLAHYRLLPEIKDPEATGGLGFAPGVVLTAESENLFPDCENQVGINNTGVVYYDDVHFVDTETGRSVVN